MVGDTIVTCEWVFIAIMDMIGTIYQYSCSIILYILTFHDIFYNNFKVKEIVMKYNICNDLTCARVSFLMNLEDIHKKYLILANND